MLVVFEGLLASLPSQQVASFAFFGIQTLAAVAMIIRKASLLSGCFFLIETNASSDFLVELAAVVALKARVVMPVR